LRTSGNRILRRPNRKDPDRWADQSAAAQKPAQIATVKPLALRKTARGCDLAPQSQAVRKGR
jgi:hypothetical protein